MSGRQLVQKKQLTKEEIKHIKKGSGSDVSSEASTRVVLGSGTFA